jgi:CubicO group peptidase (beta-lactamase class C family)
MMRMYVRLLALALLIGLALAGCLAKSEPALAVPEGAQAGDLIGLNDCQYQLAGNETQYAAECGMLTALLDEQVEKQDNIGMIMAVRLADGHVIWDTSGYISPSVDERWTPNTPSLIASVTKTFTAVVVMQLVEEENFSLDDTVDTWFPGQPNGDKITVRMLLSHTSGLAVFSSAWGADLDKWSRDWTPEELIAEANRGATVGKPGSSTAHYSNTNYIMLGRIIEKVTGNSWEHEIETRIIQPLGLKDTKCATNDNWKEITVPGYLKTSDGYLSVSEHPWYSQVSASVAWAAGGIASSVSDLMTFTSALLDGRLVSKDTLELMAQPVGTGNRWAWGLGGGEMEINGNKAFAMGGDTPGYHAFFIGTLDGRFIVTALVNSEGDVIAPSLSAIKIISQPVESN